jgi:hypothetical protein
MTLPSRLLLLVLVVTVHACAPSDQGAEPAGESSTAAEAAPTLAVDGLGELPYPMSPEELVARFGVSGPPSPEDDGEVWCTMTWLPVAAGDSILAMFTDRGLVRVDVRDTGRRTAAGVGVGSTEEEVRRAYGSAVEATPHKYTDGRYLTIRAPSGDRALVFETDEAATITTFRVGALPEVGWIEGCS